MEITAITNEEFTELRSKLLEILVRKTRTYSDVEKNLSLTEMALMTGKTKTLVKQALESLQQVGALSLETGRITIHEKT